MTTFANSAVRIVSGLDDVVRQANNVNVLSATAKMVEDDKGYTGMPELYQALLKTSGTPTFTILSGMPDVFQNRVQKFLKAQDFPPSQVNLRNVIKNWNIVPWKMEIVRRMIERYPQDKLVFILDNSNDSIHFASLLISGFSKHLGGVYLRQTTAKAVFPGTIPFYTAFDIAYHEHKSQRLSAADLEKIGHLLVKEDSGKKIIPDYSFCPLDYNPCKEKICQSVKKKVLEICELRPLPKDGIL